MFFTVLSVSLNWMLPRQPDKKTPARADAAGLYMLP